MVLNINSEFDIEAINASRERPVHTDLSDPFFPEEVETALGALKNGKFGGKNNLTPELAKRVGTIHEEYITEVSEEVWRAGCLPKEWVDAVIVAIPK